MVGMSLGSRAVVVVCALALAMGVIAPAGGATTTTIALSAPAAYADQATTLTVAVTDETGAPVVGISVSLERSVGGGWQPVGTVVTDGSGRASASLAVS